MNEIWHLLASGGAFVSSSLVSMLYHFEQRRLAQMEKTNKQLEKEIRDLCERVARLEERTTWNGRERRGR